MLFMYLDFSYIFLNTSIQQVSFTTKLLFYITRSNTCTVPANGLHTEAKPLARTV